MKTSILQTIQADFKKQKTKEKHYLVTALIALTGTFLPWFSGGVGYFKVSASGWHSWGYLSVLTSFAILALYLIPFFKVKLPAIFTNKQQEEKILSGILTTGPVFWLIDFDFQFSLLGIGFYITAIASLYLLYIVYKR